MLKALATAGLMLAAGSTVAADPVRWIASWGTAEMVAEGKDALPYPQLTDATLRQTVRLSAGGKLVRVRLSNVFGTQPLFVDRAAVALSAGPGTIEPASARPLTFDGRAGVLIPAGAAMYADPVSMPLPAGADLTISLHLPLSPDRQTGHPGSRATTFVARGDHVADAALAGADTTEHWFTIADVEVAAAPLAGTVVAIGDSITDGHAVSTDSNRRWTDRLAERMRASPGFQGWGVVNAGIGGNRVLRDGVGPNLVARFDRDVIARSNVRVAIVLEGVNDLGVFTHEHDQPLAAHAAMVADLEAAYREVVRRAHAHGIAVVGGTVMPLGGNDYYHIGPATEADRQAINRFIRSSGVFDAVVDFDRAMADPVHPDRLRPDYDSGDHLHPGERGYRAMGDAVPLALLATRPRAEASAASVAGLAAAVPPGADAPAIAFTLDDIPSHGPLPADTTRLRIAQAFTAALAAHHVPAFGFMNAGFGEGDPDSPRVLAEWRRAGLPLGNHTYHHLAFGKTPLAQWEADVVSNEPLIARYMAGADWHWLRYPFLDEGTPTNRDPARAFLAGRGYRIAAVTMSFADYDWNEPYARCVARHDTAAIIALETSYLAAAQTEALRERARSRASLGRDIPYVLLMHIGGFDAHMMPRLLDLYERLGFRFVSLPQAEADPFYRSAVDLSLPGPTATLRPLANEPALPHPDAGLCRG